MSKVITSWIRLLNDLFGDNIFIVMVHWVWQSASKVNSIKYCINTIFLNSKWCSLVSGPYMSKQEHTLLFSFHASSVLSTRIFYTKFMFSIYLELLLFPHTCLFFFILSDKFGNAFFLHPYYIWRGPYMSNHFMSFFPILSLRFSNFHSVWVQPVIYPHGYIHVMMVYGSFFMADSGISGVFGLLLHWGPHMSKSPEIFLLALKCILCFSALVNWYVLSIRF